MSGPLPFLLLSIFFALPVFAEDAIATLALKALPGQFQEMESLVNRKPGEKDITTMTLRFKTLLPHETWAPTIGICLQSKERTTDRTCFNVSTSRDGTKLLPVRRERSNPDKPPSRDTLPIELSIDEAITVRIEQTDESATFWANGDWLFET